MNLQHKGAQIIAIIIALVAGVVASYAFLVKAAPTVILDPVLISVTEGSVASYPINVRLGTIPSSEVTVTAVVAGGLLQISPASVNLTDDTPTIFEVTIPDDEENLGDVVDEIYFELTSADPNYNITSQTISITVTEDDIPGVTLGTHGLSLLSEGSSPTEILIWLDDAPTNDVVITAVADEGNLDLFPTQFTFTSVDWETPQTITITVPDDAVDLGNQTDSISFSAVSDDLAYNGIGITTLSGITIFDNDTPTNVFVFDSSSVEVIENGATGQVTIALQADTGGRTKTYDLALESGLYVAIDPVQLTFTGADYNIPQAVTITATGGAGTGDTITLSTEVCVPGGKFDPPVCSDEVIPDETIAITIISAGSDEGEEDDEEETPPPPSEERDISSGGYSIYSKTAATSRVQNVDTSVVKIDTTSSGINITNREGSLAPSSAWRTKLDTTSSKILIKGTADTEVAILQKFLNTTLQTVLKLDGKFGGQTVSAIETFQKGAGVKVDGIVGPQTRAAINKIIDADGAESGSLHEGTKGGRVIVLQQLLLLKGILVSTDGILGPKTKAGIEKFQMEHGLMIDGIAGPKTFLELQK